MAGTAHARLGAALAHNTDWIWLVDADVQPTPTALEELLRPLSAPGLPAPALITSKVVGSDGRLDLERSFWPRNRGEQAIEAAGHKLAALRLARWGSMLVHRDALLSHGLPPEDPRPRGDDLQWSSCVLATGEGYLAPRSVAVRADGRRRLSYEEARARVGMIAVGCWTTAERIRFVFRVMDDAVRELQNGPRARTLGVLGRGSVAGLAGGLRQRRGRDGLHPVAQPPQHGLHAVPPEAGPR